MEVSINNDLSKISEWLLSNKLSLNVSKSNFVNFYPKQNKTHISLIITINKELIEEKTSTKYLGIILDKHLTWRDQIASIRTKLAKTLGILHKAKHCSTGSPKATILCPIFAHLNYAILLWGNAYSSVIEPL